MFNTNLAFGAIGPYICYAMSGTDVASGGIGLRACYAISGTDLAHGGIGLRACYAMSGTDLAYGATQVTWDWLGVQEELSEPGPSLSRYCIVLRCIQMILYGARPSMLLLVYSTRHLHRIRLLYDARHLFHMKLRLGHATRRLCRILLAPLQYNANVRYTDSGTLCPVLTCGMAVPGGVEVVVRRARQQASAIVLRAPYEMSGTDLGVVTTQYPVLCYGCVVLATVSRCATSSTKPGSRGTDLEYCATRLS
eukprot:17368-Rhodomonas_salina.1